MSTHNMFSSRNKENTIWIPPLICRCVQVQDGVVKGGIQG